MQLLGAMERLSTLDDVCKHGSYDGISRELPTARRFAESPMHEAFVFHASSQLLALLFNCGTLTHRGHCGDSSFAIFCVLKSRSWLSRRGLYRMSSELRPSLASLRASPT